MKISSTKFKNKMAEFKVGATIHSSLIKIDVYLGEHRLMSFSPSYTHKSRDWEKLSRACITANYCKSIEWKMSNGDCFIDADSKNVIFEFGKNGTGNLEVCIPSKYCTSAFEKIAEYLKKKEKSRGNDDSSDESSDDESSDESSDGEDSSDDESSDELSDDE